MELKDYFTMIFINDAEGLVDYIQREAVDLKYYLVVFIDDARGLINYGKRNVGLKDYLMVFIDDTRCLEEYAAALIHKATCIFVVTRHPNRLIFSLSYIARCLTLSIVFITRLLFLVLSLNSATNVHLCHGGMLSIIISRGLHCLSFIVCFSNFSVVTASSSFSFP